MKVKQNVFPQTNISCFRMQQLLPKRFKALPNSFMFTFRSKCLENGNDYSGKLIFILSIAV